MKTASTQDSAFEGSPAQAKKLTVYEDRNIATLAHFGGFMGCIPSGIILYLYRGRGPFTEQEAREAFNFTLLPSLVIIVCMFLSVIPTIGWFFGLLAALLWIYLAFTSLVAGIKVNRGNPYQYRFNTELYDRLRSSRKNK